MEPEIAFDLFPGFLKMEQIWMLRLKETGTLIFFEQKREIHPLGSDLYLSYFAE